MGSGTPTSQESSGVAERISVPIDLWTRLVFTAKESDDGRFRSLMEQAVMEARAE